MDIKEKLKIWSDECVKEGNTPIALVCCDKDGFPIVFSDLDSKTLDVIFKHLSSSLPLEEQTCFIENN